MFYYTHHLIDLRALGSIWLNHPLVHICSSN
uniref:Uncharacterized protein n=1 Tax=viral metagenome TaxID=1070528 RepID=A0A6C0BND0_9ZZZZ